MKERFRDLGTAELRERCFGSCPQLIYIGEGFVSVDIITYTKQKGRYNDGCPPPSIHYDFS